MQLSQFIKNRYGSKKGLIRSIYYSIVGKLLPHKASIPNDITRVVFVCKGNICRSALADVYFKSVNKLECCSVGLDTTSGKKANQRILELSQKYNVNMDSHITTSISDFSPKSGDIYVCMEPEHISQLKPYINSMPVILLGLFGIPRKLYIHDPYNSNDKYAEDCVKYIMAAVSSFSNTLIHQSK